MSEFSKDLGNSFCASDSEQSFETADDEDPGAQDTVDPIPLEQLESSFSNIEIVDRDDDRSIFRDDISNDRYMVEKSMPRSLAYKEEGNEFFRLVDGMYRWLKVYCVCAFLTTILMI